MTQEHWDRIKELADNVEKSYFKKSLFNSDRKILNPKIIQNGKDFVQIATKNIIPAWVFTGSADNSMIAREFSEWLKFSELKYFLDIIEKSQEDREQDTLKNISYEEFQRILESIQNPTDIFIPIELYKEMLDFYKLGYLKYESPYYFLSFGSKKLRVYWSNVNLRFNKIYIVDISGVNWLQKKVENMTISRAKDPPDLTLLTNEKDILQISAKEVDESNYIFLMRLVAKAKIDSDKVKVVDIPNELFTIKNIKD